MAQHKVKIVDTFNGYEGPSFADLTKAKRELAQRWRDFCAHPEHDDAQFCQTIVPAHYTWYWDQRQNKFIWG